MKKNNLPQNAKRPTTAQSRAWGAFGGASFEWGNLTEDQWRGWDEAAREERRRRRWRPGRRFTGQNLFTEINSHQAFLGLSPLLDAPERPAFELDPLGPLTTGDGRDGLSLKIEVPRMPVGHTLVFGSPPCPAGRRVCRDFRFLGLLPAPERGASDLTELCVKKFGNLPDGSRVFIRIWQQVNGWRNMLVANATAVVRGKSDPTARRGQRRATGAAV